MIDPFYQGDRFTLYNGDCLAVMAQMEGCSVDAIVTDPPAGISFMGKKWDHHKGGRDAWVSWLTEVMRECLRVLKPGGHALVWALPRTSHWTGWAIESAGFEVRDRVSHLFGTGFPKSLDVSRAIDGYLDVEPKVVGVSYEGVGNTVSSMHKQEGFAASRESTFLLTAATSWAARQWEGYGTALKPACEDWWLCRKPLDGTVAQNVLKHGTGALNVDGCRVATKDQWQRQAGQTPCNEGYGSGMFLNKSDAEISPLGRWPANVTHDGSDEVVGLFPETDGSRASMRGTMGESPFSGIDGSGRNPDSNSPRGHSDNGGSAARFFYCAKPDKADRSLGLDGTCTVNYNTGLCRDANTELVQLLARVTSDLETLKWLIGESGESITGQCLRDSLSTTLTTISKITTSQILNLLTPLLTSAFIQAANCETGNGGSLAESAEPSSLSSPTTTSENQAVLARGVNHAVSKMLAVIGNAENWKPLKNFHSTVKSTELMRWLCRLITPPCGVILDCFAGSGSTGKAAMLEGFRFVGIELSAEYCELAQRRIEAVTAQQGLFTPEQLAATQDTEPAQSGLFATVGE